MNAAAALGLTAAVMLAMACSPDQRAMPGNSVAAPSAVLVRGTLLARKSSMVLVACGTTTERALSALPASRLAEALDAVTGGANDSMYVEAMADTAGGRVLVQETKFGTSLAEGARCDSPRRLLDVDALGTEPFWHVSVDGSQLVLERPEGPLELAFVADTPVTQGALTTITAHRDEGRVRDLSLGLLRSSCRDGMSDSWYPYRAEVRFGTTALHGCARR